MRLAINRASQEGWLTEHMLIMGVHGKGDRVNYFTGAFPSMCGKTSTAMINGEAIVGDDIAYIRKINGKVRAVNVESGIFGIIEGINDKDDLLQWNALNKPAEIIFTNQLVYDNNKVYWNGKPGEIPKNGEFVGPKQKNLICNSCPSIIFVIISWISFNPSFRSIELISGPKSFPGGSKNLVLFLSLA